MSKVRSCKLELLGIVNFLAHEKKMDTRILENVGELLTRAVPFHIQGYAGPLTSLNVPKRCAVLEDLTLHLPYDVTLLEFGKQKNLAILCVEANAKGNTNPSENSPFEIAAAYDSNLIVCHIFVHMDGDYWDINPYTFVMVCDPEARRDKAGDEFREASIVRSATSNMWVASKLVLRDWMDFIAETDNEMEIVGQKYPAQEGFKMEVSASEFVVCDFLSQLAQPHTTIETLQPAPKFLNKARAKKGKLPLDEIKHLVIHTPSVSIKTAPQGGTHASPREHQRRGHWRHYASGKRAWIRDCIVGTRAYGRIRKDYEVRPDND